MTFLNTARCSPTTPNPVGPPLDYMAECKVFDGIRSDLYDLCCFYVLGTTGDPPEFPTLWEPVMCSQVRDLLKLAQSLGHPYMILAHSTNSVTAVPMLLKLHMATCLRHLQVDLWDKSVKMLFCPFCMYMGANDLSYLNHIIIVHYNTSYGCRKCLKQAFVSSSALHNHKKVCLRFTKKPAAGSDSKPSSSSGGDGSQGSGSTRATPKKKDPKALATDSQGSSAPTALQMTPHCNRHDKSHCSKPHKDSKSKKDSSSNKKKKKHASPTRKGSAHKSHKHSPTRTQSPKRTHQATRRRRSMQAPLGRALLTSRTNTAANVRPAFPIVPLSHQCVPVSVIFLVLVFSQTIFVVKLMCLL